MVARFSSSVYLRLCSVLLTVGELSLLLLLLSEVFSFVTLRHSGLKDSLSLVKILFPPLLIEAATRGVLYKKVFLEISQNSQKNTCARVSPATLLKKRPQHRCFPVNFAKFLRTPFSQNTSGRLLLYLLIYNVEIYNLLDMDPHICRHK